MMTLWQLLVSLCALCRRTKVAEKSLSPLARKQLEYEQQAAAGDREYQQALEQERLRQAEKKRLQTVQDATHLECFLLAQFGITTTVDPLTATFVMDGVTFSVHRPGGRKINAHTFHPSDWARDVYAEYRGQKVVVQETDMIPRGDIVDTWPGGSPCSKLAGIGYRVATTV